MKLYKKGGGTQRSFPSASSWVPDTVRLWWPPKCPTTSGRTGTAVYKGGHRGPGMSIKGPEVKGGRCAVLPDSKSLHSSLTRTARHVLCLTLSSPKQQQFPLFVFKFVSLSLVHAAEWSGAFQALARLSPHRLKTWETRAALDSAISQRKSYYGKNRHSQKCS